MKQVLAGIFLSLLALPAAAHSLDGLEAEILAREPGVRFLPEPGMALPAVDLKDVAGKVARLEDYRGKILVLVLVPSSCNEPCLRQGAALARIQQDVAVGHMTDLVRFVGVSLAEAGAMRTARADLGGAAKLDPANWTALAGVDAAAIQRFTAGLAGATANASPSEATYVIDGAGRLRARFLGTDFDPLDVVLYVNALLNDHDDHDDDAPPPRSLWATLKAWF